jgi:AcrR family transcriptional regulator
MEDDAMKRERTPRESYHHGDLRATLMALAERQIAASGTEKLSLRALAADAGVSATAPYRHFPSKTCLLAALAIQGFRQLREEVAVAGGAPATMPPGERLLAAAEVYVCYALAHPVKYQLMFGEVLGDFSPYEQLRQAASECFGGLLEMIAAGIDSGDFVDRPVEELGASVWAACHGVASLLIGKGRAVTRHEHPLLPRDSLVWLQRNQREALRLLLTGIMRR